MHRLLWRYVYRSRHGRPDNSPSIVNLVAWVLPSFLAAVSHKKLVPKLMNQRLILAFQLIRSIGSLFLWEAALGNLPWVFALPAGLGGILTGVIPIFILVIYRKRNIPKDLIIIEIVIGMKDFLSAFFFGFTSSDGPFKLFATTSTSQVTRFPVGVVPSVIVPIATLFHTLAIINLLKFPDDAEKTTELKKTSSV
jgi:hypothetical protein